MRDVKLAELKDLVTELKDVNGSLNLLACVVAEGIGADRNNLTPKYIEENIFCATRHIDRIVDEMNEKMGGDCFGE